MSANYDRIAGNYDWLSRLVFGKAQVEAQVGLLKTIQPGANILLAGGGTGWLLEDIARMYPSGLRLVYVDNSAEMLGLARKRNFGNNAISFVQDNIQDFHSSEQFDVVITPFLFDNLTANAAVQAFSKLDQMLIPGGMWLYTDFRIAKKNSSVWQRLLLRFMYLFFKVIADLDAKTLPDMQFLFNQNQYRRVLDSLHYKGFIESIAYQKSADHRPVSAE